MRILLATLSKDFKLILRDRPGLLMMFLMPILLVIVITTVQNSTFELVNNNKVSLLIYNEDKGEKGVRLIEAVRKIGLFKITLADPAMQKDSISKRMYEKDALVAVLIPAGFSSAIEARAAALATRAIDLDSQSVRPAGRTARPDSLVMYYHPVMQLSFRQSVEGALQSAVQVIQGEAIVKDLYQAVNSKAIPPDLEKEILFGQIPVTTIPVSRNGSRVIPNASQHNVPAWTLFAMFFIVISLGSNVVREKNTGSFIRMKSLPASYGYALLSKQLVYICVTFCQAMAIFAVGRFLFPFIGLPTLHLPAEIPGLIIVTFLCGWCAASYAICVGVFAQTQEQSNGFGAISIIILAAIGGLLVPSFAMPASMQTVLRISPLHWGLEAYYGLFLEGGNTADILPNILSLVLITIGIQLLTFYGLKKKNLI